MSVVVQKSDKVVNIEKKSSQVVINRNTASSSNFSQFSTTADSGTTSITSGETLTLTGGTGITTAVSGDTVTFSVTDAEVLLQDENINGGQF